MRLLLCLGLLIVHTLVLKAQSKTSPYSTNSFVTEPYFGSDKLIVPIDDFSNIPEKDVPFDRYFYFSKNYSLSTNIYAIECTGNFDKDGIAKSYKIYFFSKIVKDSDSDEKNQQVFMLVPPLLPGKKNVYNLLIFKHLPVETKNKIFDAFVDIKKGNLIEAKKKINELNLAKRAYNSDHFIKNGAPDFSSSDLIDYYNEHLDPLITSWINEISPDSQDTIKENIFKVFDEKKFITRPDNSKKDFLFEVEHIGGNTESATFDARTKYLITPDFGAITYGFQDKFFGVTPYVGVCFNFRSFDPDIPLSKIRHTLKFDKFLGIIPYRFLSVTVGVTLRSVAKANYRADIIGSNSLFAGVGYRLTNALKLNVGALGYSKLDANPLLDRKKLAVVPYIGFSVDMRVREILKDVGAIFTGKF